MKSSIAIITFLLAFMACNSSQKAATVNQPEGEIESLNVDRAQLLQVKESAVLLLSKATNPNTIEQYFVLQGARTKDINISTSILNYSNDFASLQSGNDFWILALSKSDRYKKYLNQKANQKVIKGYGLAKYNIEGVDFNTFVEELKAGKHDSKF